jgi:hypothetical protein
MDEDVANKFKRAYTRVPTFIGLEKIMRFCLLRFIYKNGVGIEERLGDNKNI